MKNACTLCGTVMDTDDVVCAGNAQHVDGQAVCRDCTYNPAPTPPPPVAVAVR